MPKITFLLLPLFGSFNLHSQSAFVPAFSTILKNDQGKAIMAQCSRSIPDKVTGYYDLSEAEVAKLDSNFRKLIYVKSTGCCIVRETIKNLDKYAYQYIGLTIGKEKYIYINAFAVDPTKGPDDKQKDWKETPIIVCDGGSGFWGALFKISDGTFTELAVNGTA